MIEISPETQGVSNGGISPNGSRAETNPLHLNGHYIGRGSVPRPDEYYEFFEIKRVIDENQRKRDIGFWRTMGGNCEYIWEEFAAPMIKRFLGRRSFS